MSNFDFLKKIDADLHAIVNDAEKLYRDEYFEQCIVQTRRFAENVCKNMLEKLPVSEGTFDEMLCYLSDKTKGRPVEKEFIDDLYFIKKAGNQSAHGAKVNKQGMVALECLQRAFEIAINFAAAKGFSDNKIQDSQYDVDLLLTGKKSQKTLAEKYQVMQAKTAKVKTKIKNSKTTYAKSEQYAPEHKREIGVVRILFSSLIILTLLIIAGFFFL